MIQTIGYGFLLYLIDIQSLTMEGVFNVLFIGRVYWFVIAYMILYILSPFINHYVDNSDKHTLKKLIFSFLIFEFIFGWLGGVGAFSDGYSAISFIGIYGLGRYLRTYSPEIKQPFLVFIGLAIFSTLSIIGSLLYLPESTSYSIHRLLIAYNSPTVVIASVCLFYSFKKLSFKSNIVNWMASSALCIYLIHLHPVVFNNYFTPIVRLLFDNQSYLLLMAFLIGVCVACILIDKIRLAIYYLLTPLLNIIFNWLKKILLTIVYNK